MVIMGSDKFHLDPMIGGYLNTLSPFSGSGINDEGSVMFEDLTQLQLRHLRSNVEMAEYGDGYEVSDEYDGVQMDDQFRMYEFKVKRCGRGRSHDWTDCPYAHPGEKARRRDPRKYHYSGNPCAEFRKGGCRKGDGCEFAHGVFECWLHPSRYRTQPCKDGLHCPRRICFFAHTPEQLRILPPSYHVSIATQSYDGSPSQGSFGSSSSPTSTLYFPHCSTPTDSPPMSPLGLNSVGDLTFSMRNLQIGKSTRLMNGYSPPQIQHSVRPTPSPPWLRALELWDDGDAAEEGMMERVESGKDIRARIYAKLSRENSLSESRGV